MALNARERLWCNSARWGSWKKGGEEVAAPGSWRRNFLAPVRIVALGTPRHEFLKSVSSANDWFRLNHKPSVRIARVCCSEHEEAAPQRRGTLDMWLASCSTRLSDNKPSIPPSIMKGYFISSLPKKFVTTSVHNNIKAWQYSHSLA
jgi:hypothetical protein